MHTTIIPAPYYGYYHHLPFAWNQVQYMVSDRNYTCFVLIHAATHFTTKTLNTYESHIPAYMMRVHKSYTVNLHFVAQLDRENRTLIMQNGQVIPIARRRWRKVVNVVLVKQFLI